MSAVNPHVFVDGLVHFIEVRRHVTMVEIRDWLHGQGLPTHGALSLTLPRPHDQIVLWANMSQEWIDVMYALQRDGRLRMEPASWLCYLCDGGMLELPLARRPPKGGYRTPHWAPIVFNLRHRAK